MHFLSAVKKITFTISLFPIHFFTRFLQRSGMGSWANIPNKCGLSPSHWAFITGTLAGGNAPLNKDSFHERWIFFLWKSRGIVWLEISSILHPGIVLSSKEKDPLFMEAIF